MYVPDWTLSDYPPEHQPAIERFIDSCRKSKAMVWASPTYHGTVSGVFKNALDFIEMLSEETPAYLNGKAVGLISINDSKTFSAMSNSVHELQAWLAPTHVVLKKADFTVNDEIHLSSESGTRRVTRLVNELMHFLR
jgi:NAD(P)H-dependent FMN reductase